MKKGLEEKLLLSKREEEGEERLGRKICAESKKLWIVAGPAIFTRFSTFGVSVISQAFIGHIGSTELAAFALVSTVLLRFGNGILGADKPHIFKVGPTEFTVKERDSQPSSHVLSTCALHAAKLGLFLEALLGDADFLLMALSMMLICHPNRSQTLGMASALETLCGQAYGAKQYHMLGIYLQRSWIVLITCAIFILPIFIFTAPILRLLGQSDDIAAMAGTISLWFIPVIFSFVFSFTLQMYLQAQSKNIIIAYLAAITLAIHVLLSWVMAIKLRLGVAGVMGSMILANWIPIVGQMAFVVCGGCPDTWNGFSMLAFRDLWPVVKLSLSSGAMLCLELWYNTVLVLLTGHMKNAEIAIDSLSICLNINGWEMMISLGFLAAASVRVSNELGRGNAKAAKFSVIVTVASSLSIGLVLFTMFMLFRGKISYVFTNSPEVSRAVAYLSPLLSFSILLNSVQPVLSGVAVGAGWQSVVAYVNLTCYYLIGIPVGVVLGYAIGFQVKGIWIGMLFGTAVQTLVLSYLTWRTDWDKQVAMALARVNKYFVPSSKETDGSPPTA